MALGAAESIIASEGYAALSARKVAAAIGYTVGTLYLVFRNLDDLVMQVNERSLDALYATLTEAVASHRNYRASALALGRSYLRFATEHPNRWGAIFEHRLASGAAPPARYLDKVARSFGLVEKVLERLAPQRPTEEIGKAARALWSGVHGVCILGLTQRLEAREAGYLEELVDSLIANYLIGFTGTPTNTEEL